MVKCNIKQQTLEYNSGKMEANNGGKDVVCGRVGGYLKKSTAVIVGLASLRTLTVLESEPIEFCFILANLLFIKIYIDLHLCSRNALDFLPSPLALLLHGNPNQTSPFISFQVLNKIRYTWTSLLLNGPTLNYALMLL